MEQRGFGRRRDLLPGFPAQDTASVAARPGVAKRLADDGRATGWRRVLGLAFMALCLAIWLEALFSGTSLITPISSTYLWTMRIIGSLVGLAILPAMLAANALEIGWFKKILIVIFTPVVMAMLFDALAWRAADWSAFGLSNQPFTEARYPIKDISFGHKGSRDSVEIDPYDTGESAVIPMPSSQLDYLSYSAIGQCVTVLERRSPGGAVEIRTNGGFTLAEPEPLKISPCTRSNS